MSETIDFKEMIKGLPQTTSVNGPSSQYTSPHSILTADKGTGAVSLLNLARFIPFAGKVEISSLEDLDNLGSYGTCVMMLSSAAQDPEHINIISSAVLIQFCFFTNGIRQQILISGFAPKIWYRCMAGINQGKWHRVDATLVTTTT